MEAIHRLKNLLFSAYPTIPPYVVRTPHPEMTDDREHITSQNASPVSSSTRFAPGMSAAASLVAALSSCLGPVGGRLSKALTSLLLCGLEMRWHNDSQRRAAKKMSQWHLLTKAARFVDDGALHAQDLCQLCIQTGLSAIYSAPLCV